MGREESNRYLPLHKRSEELGGERLPRLKIDRNAPGPRWTDEQVTETFEMSRYTVIRIRERFVNNGLDDALNHRHHLQPGTRLRWRARGLPDRRLVAHLLQDKPFGP